MNVQTVLLRYASSGSQTKEPHNFPYSPIEAQRVQMEPVAVAQEGEWKETEGFRLNPLIRTSQSTS